MDNCFTQRGNISTYSMLLTKDILTILQWNPDFSKPRFFEPPHYWNKNSFPLDLISVDATLDFPNQFLLPLEVSKLEIPLYIVQTLRILLLVERLFTSEFIQKRNEKKMEARIRKYLGKLKRTRK